VRERERERESVRERSSCADGDHAGRLIEFDVWGRERERVRERQ